MIKHSIESWNINSTSARARCANSLHIQWLRHNCVINRSAMIDLWFEIETSSVPKPRVKEREQISWAILSNDSPLRHQQPLKLRSRGASNVPLSLINQFNGAYSTAQSASDAEWPKRPTHRKCLKSEDHGKLMATHGEAITCLRLQLNLSKFKSDFHQIDVFFSSFKSYCCVAISHWTFFRKTISFRRWSKKVRFVIDSAGPKRRI